MCKLTLKLQVDASLTKILSKAHNQLELNLNLEAIIITLSVSPDPLYTASLRSNSQWEPTQATSRGHEPRS